jgi:hypothetical protein
MTDSALDELVLLNTRVTRRVRRALDLVAISGRTLQGLTTDALTAYLTEHYPDALAAVGDQARETEQATLFMAQRQH